MEKLKNILNDNVKESMNFIRINLNHFKINVLKKIAVLTEDYIMEEEDNLHAQWYLALHDIITQW